MIKHLQVLCLSLTVFFGCISLSSCSKKSNLQEEEITPPVTTQDIKMLLEVTSLSDFEYTLLHPSPKHKELSHNDKIVSSPEYQTEFRTTRKLKVKLVFEGQALFTHLGLVSTSENQEVGVKCKFYQGDKLVKEINTRKILDEGASSNLITLGWDAQNPDK